MLALGVISAVEVQCASNHAAGPLRPPYPEVIIVRRVVSLASPALLKLPMTNQTLGGLARQIPLHPTIPGTASVQVPVDIVPEDAVDDVRLHPSVGRSAEIIAYYRDILNRRRGAGTKNSDKTAPNYKILQYAVVPLQAVKRRRVIARRLQNRSVPGAPDRYRFAQEVYAFGIDAGINQDSITAQRRVDALLNGRK